MSARKPAGVLRAPLVEVDRRILRQPLEVEVRRLVREGARNFSLVREPEKLRAPFSHNPSYFHFEGLAEDPPINFYDWGMQNSRGFRALKVWLAFRHVGRVGYTNHRR